MAKDAVVVFLKQLAEDDSTRKSYAASLRDATESAMVAVARSQGLEFTVEELRTVLAEGAPQLSDSELDKVAGGFGVAASQLGARNPLLGIWTGGLRKGTP